MKRLVVSVNGLFGLALVLSWHIQTARAADTTEPFAIGASNVDFYLGYDGLGLSARSDHALFGEMMLGYGLLDRLSAFLGTNLQGNGRLADGVGTVYLGLYGTPLDTRHVDLDLFLSIDGGGVGFSQFGVTPAIEFNIDLDPNMQSWGVYVRSGVRLFNQTAEAEEQSSGGVRYHIALILGTYYTISARHQLLLESDIGVCPDPSDDERQFEVGGLALGYNVTLSDRIELINQVFIDIPQSGEKTAAGIMTGFIVTLESH